MYIGPSMQVLSPTRPLGLRAPNWMFASGQFRIYGLCEVKARKMQAQSQAPDTRLRVDQRAPHPARQPERRHAGCSCVSERKNGIDHPSAPQGVRGPSG